MSGHNTYDGDDDKEKTQKTCKDNVLHSQVYETNHFKKGKDH